MPRKPARAVAGVITAIRASGLTIYHSLDSRPDLCLRTEQLQEHLQKSLVGLRLHYALRTRSKILKSRVCEALGYPVPAAFKRTKPRFPGQDFDTYVQKANNLQIWNEEIVPSRRYAIIRVDEQQTVRAVRVVSGEVLALLDTTGTLTRKYQARSAQPIAGSTLVCTQDTRPVLKALAGKDRSGGLLPIADVYRILLRLIGRTFDDPGIDQERNRGGLIHQMVSGMFPGNAFHDSGRFPDVPGQLLEVKFQTSPTIDLGLVSPDATEHLIDQPGYRHCDVRCAVFYGSITGPKARIDHLVVSTGQEFFRFFRRFKGKVVNKKIQIPLPRDFFG